MFQVFLGKLQNSFFDNNKEKSFQFFIFLVAHEIAIKLVQAPAVTHSLRAAEREDALLVWQKSVQKPRLCRPVIMIN